MAPAAPELPGFCPDICLIKSSGGGGGGGGGVTEEREREEKSRSYKMLLPAAEEVVEGVLVTRDGDGDAVDFCCLLSSCFFSSAWASLEPASTSLVTLPTQYFCHEKHRHPPLWSPCPHNTFVMKNTSIYLFGHPAYTFLLWPTPVSTSLVTLTTHFCYGKHWCPPLWSTCPHKSSVMENTSVHLLGHPAHTSFLLPCPHDILVMENTGVHLFHHPAHTTF